MHLILTASKDTYITNKIIHSSFRATDANVGRAGTIDLFKLYGETPLPEEENPIELSRALIKFDLGPLYALTSSNLDIDNFKCFLSLTSIDTGHFTPNGFNLKIYPVSQSWDEGIGRDTSNFSDLDVANFITASFASPDNVPWFSAGADARGLLGSDDIDIISSGNVGSGIEDFFAEQFFDSGQENLYVDVTKLISSTLLGALPDHGFRISFDESEEQDQQTRFVKRFYSRHSNNPFKRPTLRVLFDDSLHDDSNSFFFNTTGSVFLANTIRGKNTYLLSGSDLDVISGDDCLLLRLTTGSYFEMFFSASSYRVSNINEPIEGIYRSTFCLPYTDQSLVISGTQNFTIYDIARASGSIKFDTTWMSTDQNVIFSTGSLTVSRPRTSSFNAISQTPHVKIVNLRSRYSSKDTARIRLFGINRDDKIHLPVKLPVYAKSDFFEDVFYSIKEMLTGEIVVPFDTEFNSTRASRDSEGHFFDVKMSMLPPEKNYYFEFLIKNNGTDFIDSQKNINFRVEK